MSENHNLASADWKNAGGLQEREIVAGATDFEVNTYKLKHNHINFAFLAVQDSSISEHNIG